MIDIKRIVEEAQAVKDCLVSRNSDPSVVDQVIALNNERKQLTQSVETKKASVNAISREIGELKKNKQDAQGKMDEVASIKKSMTDDEARLAVVQEEQSGLLLTIPNLLDASVPKGKDEEQNVEYRRWGTPRVFDFTPADTPMWAKS